VNARQVLVAVVVVGLIAYLVSYYIHDAHKKTNICYYSVPVRPGMVSPTLLLPSTNCPSNG
jgi:1,4-dihydroxy-2-naphthoate octaprenyltransferase